MTHFIKIQDLHQAWLTPTKFWAPHSWTPIPAQSTQKSGKIMISKKFPHSQSPQKSGKIMVGQNFPHSLSYLWTPWNYYIMILHTCDSNPSPDISNRCLLSIIKQAVTTDIRRNYLRVGLSHLQYTYLVSPIHSIWWRLTPGDGQPHLQFHCNIYCRLLLCSSLSTLPHRHQLPTNKNLQIMQCEFSSRDPPWLYFISLSVCSQNCCIC
mgnify:CR=1 FL=1